MLLPSQHWESKPGGLPQGQGQIGPDSVCLSPQKAKANETRTATVTKCCQV